MALAQAGAEGVEGAGVGVGLGQIGVEAADDRGQGRRGVGRQQGDGDAGVVGQDDQPGVGRPAGGGRPLDDPVHARRHAGGGVADPAARVEPPDGHAQRPAPVLQVRERRRRRQGGSVSSCGSRSAVRGPGPSAGVATDLSADAGRA